MSDLHTAANRPRTASRLKGVAPPGVEAPKETKGKTVGRYEIIEVLGKGAMGVVYRARDPMLDREVAVKTIVAPRGGRSARARKAYLERFQREAKAAAKMQHPAIVTIFDVGQDGEAPYMVLEYLPGESLADRLDRVRMPLARCVEISRDLASALAFAHSQRVVHRDVKPANVLHAGENRWKLADFGIVRLPDSDLTQAGIFMGTPGYAPPEAIREGSYTPQADVFAWGAVLYELLSGRIPYEGPDTQTTNGYVIKATAQSPRVHDPSIPGPLADLCMQALHPDPKIRFKNGAEIESAIGTAWDKCLNDALVHPSALAKKEQPHERVRGPMHGPAVSEPPRAPTGETVPDGAAYRGGVEDFDGGDNEPTKLMVRDGALSGQPPRAPGDESIIIEEGIPVARSAGPGADMDSILAQAAATNKRSVGAGKKSSLRVDDTATLMQAKQAKKSAVGKVLLFLLVAAIGAALSYYGLNYL